MGRFAKELIESMQQAAGHARVEEFFWPAIAEDYRAVYRSVTVTATAPLREAS